MPVPDVVAESPGFLPWLAFEAARTHRKQVSDTRSGLLPPAIGPQPALSTNTHPTGARPLRTLVRHRSQLNGPTATVATLAAVSAALSGHLGEVVSPLVAEVTMKPGVPHAHNHFANVTVGLYARPGMAGSRREDRRRPDQCPPPLRASRAEGGGSGLRRDACSVAAWLPGASASSIPKCSRRW